MLRLSLALGLAVAVAGAPALGTAGPAHAAAPAPVSGVASIQVRLAELGYLPANAVTGRIDDRTRQAVLAFQGWEGLQRDGVPGPETRARLAASGRPQPFPGTGSRIEIHIDRQVALLVSGNRVVRAIHVSTGGRATPTPTGGFRVFRKERDSWSVPYRVWLPWASYFAGGIALHGYPDVPAYPASHGCVRIPLSEAQTVYAFARLGVPVQVVP
jgi:peptidoglycan hydrolase-like protein with peptidoglycan-binding domain